VAETSCGYVKDLIFHDFVEAGKKKYVLKEIVGMNRVRTGTVRIPKTVEKIGEKCFHELEALSEIAFESDCRLKEIGKSAFRDSGLKSIRIPKTVEKIGEKCFYFCESLSEVTFESDCQLKEIGESAFDMSKVTAIEIPSKCETLTGLSLSGLKSVTVCRGNKTFVLNDDFLIEPKKERLIRFFGKGSSVLIKRSIEIISDGCFWGCESLYEVTFESDCQLKEIGKSAFYFSGLKSIRIPKNAEKIGQKCFYYCESLYEVTFESDCQLKEIGESAFSSSGLTSFRIP
jgi:hypothetical protein